MNIQATKLELIRIITDIQSEQLLERMKQFLKEAEREGLKGEGVHALSKEETRLFTAINEGLPDSLHYRFMELQAKQKESALTEKEQEELTGLVDQIEALGGKRLESMIALAELWSISLEDLRERLGIKAPEPHVW